MNDHIEHNVNVLGITNPFDLLMESVHVIYVNNWEIHTTHDLSDSHLLILNLLEKTGYLNDTPPKIVYHNKFLNFLVDKKEAIKQCNDFYVCYKLLPRSMILGVDAFLLRRKSMILDVPDDPHNAFYKMDTSYNVVDVITRQ